MKWGGWKSWLRGREEGAENLERTSFQAFWKLINKDNLLKFNKLKFLNIHVENMKYLIKSKF